jgi:uncharacterized RDD family membrane protein YckC
VSAADPAGPEDGEGSGRRRPPAYAVAAAESGQLASIGQRIGARLLDGLIIGLPLFVLILATTDFSDDQDAISTPLWVQLVATAVSALYEVVLIRTRGQTIGKRVLGIKVVRSTDGALPDWTASIVRYILPVLAALLPVPIVNVLLSLAIYLVAIVHPLRQGWHDRAAGTVVVLAEVPSPPAPPPPPESPPPSVNGDG